MLKMSILKSTGSLNSENISQSLLSISDTPTWYHNLPTGLLVKIFKHFEECELRQTIIPVCKRWRHAGLRPELWKKLKISGSDVPINFIYHKIRNLQNLESIYIDNISEPITVIRQISRCLPMLKHLTVKNCPTIPETVMRNLIQCCKKIETIDISGTGFTANRFYEEIAGLTNLKSINLSKSTGLNVHNLLSLALNCHNLEELRLSYFSPIKPMKQLNDEDASFIISNLAPYLKSLAFDTRTLTNFSFKTIMQCKNLEQLQLNGATNLSPDLFITMWKNFPKLRVIKISHAHQITGEHVFMLFSKGRDVMKNITAVDFTGCWKITDIGIETISNCCENLELLELKSCKSIYNLHSVSDNCKKLHKINIAFCSNLDLHSLLPLPENLTILITDNNTKFLNIIKIVVKEKKNLAIKISLSEYNKQMENYINS